MVVKGGILNLNNPILAGDLNLTLNNSEVWGEKARLDPLGPFFTNLFSSHQLVDIAPIVAGPTRRNGRSGADGISKGLDRFLLSTNLLEHLPLYRSWTHALTISDHYPALLEWKEDAVPKKFPFKFNRSWISFED